LSDLSTLRQAIARAWRADETAAVDALVKEAWLGDEPRRRIGERTRGLVAHLRTSQAGLGSFGGVGGIEPFLQEFGLSSSEGVALMCLAEALLRIPDADTANRLIRDRIGGADWDRHLGHAENLFVNASTWALMMTGRVMTLDDHDPAGEPGVGSPVWALRMVERLINRTGEPVIRQAMIQAMRILGRQFVLGQTLGEAIPLAHEIERQGYRFSFDMLGEAARTQDTADTCFRSYLTAIDAVGDARRSGILANDPGVSVKLSALHPRFEPSQAARVMVELAPRLLELATLARAYGVGLTIDTEEADRLELTLDVFAHVLTDPGLAGWDGFGLAVQAYQKRAPQVLDWLTALARQQGQRIPVRLVKGAYWDTEIKRAQERGLEGYPVFTRKASTDTSYLACARRLFARKDAFRPQFATHNAHTVAAVIELAGGRADYEFQRLHGMGEGLYQQIICPGGGVPCRVYAPVGSHEHLLSYLVRRMLENGANSSFVNRVQDPTVPLERFAADPIALTAGRPRPHPAIPLPAALFAPERRNSAGLELADSSVTAPLLEDMERWWRCGWTASPITPTAPGVQTLRSAPRPVIDPADQRRTVGTVVEASAEEAKAALAIAFAARREWAATPVTVRAAALDRAADLYERHRNELMALLVREAGKTIADALAELREAVDFLRYYAAQARRHLAAPIVLPGPTGERNQLSWHARGVFLAISPWNFPLAIFTGQVAAALVTGNPVLAKPAEQTPLVAARATRLLLEAGIPPAVVQLLPGAGPALAGALVPDPRLAGVVFTGSLSVAKALARGLAAREGALVPLIAETGGQNAMIVDASALPEQVVDDVLTSAFRSAGQRCSALRVLFVQDSVAERMLGLLAGAAAELRIGDPGRLETDVGPVIDGAARDRLHRHANRLATTASRLFQVRLNDACAHGTFFAPKAFEIDRLERLTQDLHGEVFGPILHVIRYAPGRLDQVLDTLAATGWGLTLGIHSRIERTCRDICERLPVGNQYVNRSMIGAVVGVQPFGGEGLSGTGPKAGGPQYLFRFMTERTLSINTSAAGGNTALISLEE